MRFKLRFWNLFVSATLVFSVFLGSTTQTKVVKAVTSDLFFSEYIEGSSNNKAIEIFNGTGADVDLTEFTVELYTNGSTTVGQTQALSGTLANGEVFVIANASANAAILAVADITSAVTFYNGDDVLLLKHNGEVIDSIGQLGFDPGTNWTSNGVATSEQTLRRKNSICVGDADSSNTYDPSVEWDSFPVDTFDGLDSHTAACYSGNCGSVYFSEYIEGSSNNKAIEIFNGTGADVDLTEFTVELYTNGSTTVGQTQALSGTLADGEVFVIANASANAAILAVADITSAVTFYNGDDVLLLKQNGEVIDSIGQLGFDPGTNWTSNGVATSEQTLRRMVGISSGDADSSDAYDPSAEWDSFPVDTFDGLGSHTAACGPVDPNLPITFTCPSGIITFPGIATSELFSATDADGTVIDASITNGGTAGISIIDLVPATEIGGELTGTLDVDDTVIGGTYDVEITFSNDDTPDAQTAACTVPVTVVPSTCPVVDSHQIGEVQGETDTSPVNGSSVTVSGIVVGDFQTTFSGFHIQDPDGDTNALTSDGVFVYNTSHPVSVGDPVQITATVSEYNGLTELTSVSAFSMCGTQQTILPTSISLPVLAVSDFEKYEGMLVTFPQDLVISEYFNFDRFGEIVLTSSRHLTPTAIYEPGSPEQAAAALAYTLDRITLDDGRSSQNPDPAIHPNGLTFNLDNLFRGGDQVTNVTGVMDYSFNLYRIQPTIGAEYTPVNLREVLHPEVGGKVEVASFNVLNYFTTLDTGAFICGPSQDMECRGADTAEELVRQRNKIVAAISAINADVVGLMEIENNINDDAVIDLVASLNTVMGAGTYDYINTGVIGTDAIKVAMIYKPASISLIGNFAILDTTVDARFLDDKNRPVLAQSFQDPGTGTVFTVAVNHLKSKGSDCVDVGDPDLGDGAGNCNVTRENAALALVDWLESDPTTSGFNNNLIIGDLNSYDKEDPIDAIKAGSDDTLLTDDDYIDLVFEFQGEEAYGYVFDGQTGYLDHALGNQGMEALVTGVDYWHINADEPDLIDYDMSFKLPAQDLLYAADAYRSSDHDPVIIGLTFFYDYFFPLIYK